MYNVMIDLGEFVADAVRGDLPDLMDAAMEAVDTTDLEALDLPEGTPTAQERADEIAAEADPCNCDYMDELADNLQSDIEQTIREMLPEIIERHYMDMLISSVADELQGEVDDLVQEIEDEQDEQYNEMSTAADEHAAEIDQDKEEA